MIRRTFPILVVVALLAPFTHAADENKRLSDLGPQHPQVVRAKEQAQRRGGEAMRSLHQARPEDLKMQGELRGRTGRIDVAPEAPRPAGARPGTERANPPP